MNGQQLVDLCSTRFRDLHHVLVNEADWLNLLSHALAKMLRVARIPFEEAATTIDFAAGDLSQSLPAAVYHVLAVRDTTDGELLTPIHSRTEFLRSYPDDEEDHRGSPGDYHLRGGRLFLRPIPDTDMTVEVTYSHASAEVDLGEISVLPVEYHRDLAEGALEMAFADDGQADQSALAGRRFADALQRFKVEAAHPRYGEQRLLPRWGARK